MIYRICVATLLCFWFGECLHAQSSPCDATITTPDTEICGNKTVVVAQKPVTGETGLWTVPSGVGIVNASTSVGNIYNLNPGVNIITWTIYDTNGQECSSASIEIISSVVVLPIIDMPPNNSSYCFGESVQLEGAAGPGDIGTWSAGEDVIFTPNANDPNAIISNLEDGANIIFWTLTEGGCSSTESITIFHEAAPVIEPTSVLTGCLGDQITLNAFIQNLVAGESWEWTSDAPNFETSDEEIIYPELSLGTYTFTLTLSNNSCPDRSIDVEVIVCDCDEVIEEVGACESTFTPVVGRRYVLSAWVKGALSADKLTYENISVILSFGGVAGSLTFFPEGGIIDGWQRIEEEFTVPSAAATFNIQLHNTDPSAQAFFDDIRVHPFDANMRSFVYDPVTLRLSAELDERNYATYYEYDEEGALIRVKKETERGIMTIQEGRNSIRKN